jgi:hypothetical protein
MAKTTACDYEGTGPTGTTLTNANTGGTVAIGVSCTAVSTSSAAWGSYAGSFSVPATNVSSRLTSSAVTGTQFALSFKFRVPTAFATTKRIIIPQNAAFGIIASFNYNGSTNRLQIQNQAGAGTLTHAAALTLNTWYRVETVFTVATSTTGFFRTNIYDNEGTTPLAAATTSSTFDMGTTGMFQIVQGITANGTTVAATVDIDSVRFDSGRESEIGPDAASTLSSDADLRWLVRNLLNSDLDARWRVRSVMSSDLDARWLVRNVVAASDLDTRWLVRNALSSDLDTRWLVRNVASSDLDARWTVRNALTSDLGAVWRVRALLATDLDTRWRVRTSLDVDLDTRWRVRNALASDLDIDWRVYNRLVSDLDTRWRVLQPPRDVVIAAALAAQGRTVAGLHVQDRIAVTLGAHDG